MSDTKGWAPLGTSLLALCLAAGAFARTPTDPDSDGDGLPDFQEIHKYRTDPGRADSDGDGVPDGNWLERREYTYTIQAVLHVLPPCDTTCVNDDYQDARVGRGNGNYMELEVVSYPFNTNLEAVAGDAQWRAADSTLREYLEPGITTNWDRAMRDELLRELSAQNLHPETLDDRRLVEDVSKWLLSRSQRRYMFGTYFVRFPNGKPEIHPGLEAAFRKERGDSAWTPAQQFDHELFGREMFRNRSYGTCTSAATYLATGLRALGIPTRLVLAIPVLDACDSTQVRMVREGLRNEEVRRTLEASLAGCDFTAHTLDEVWVGGRWRRLNYAKLGQNVLDPKYLGLMIHVNTFRDLSEAGLAETWGWRYGRGERDAEFRFSNPYRLVHIEDAVGEHSRHR